MTTSNIIITNEKRNVLSIPIEAIFSKTQLVMYMLNLIFYHKKTS